LLSLLLLLTTAALLTSSSVLASAEDTTTTEFEVGLDGEMHLALSADNDNDDDDEQLYPARTRTEVDSSEDEYPDCQDLSDECTLFVDAGHCDAIEGTPEWMYVNCARSCELCGKGEIADLLAHAMKLRNDDLAISRWGEEQSIEESRIGEYNVLLKEIERYMLEEVNVEDKYKKIKKQCQNRHPDCTFWALEGECEANPDYMLLKCAPSCKTCHMIDFNFRCPMPENIPEIDAWKPGDLDKMFERIVATIPYVNIHSRPSPVESEDGPWVITIDQFLSDEECERLIELGYAQGYERSADVGKMNFDGTFESSVNDGRTSTNAWCVDDCVNDQQTQIVLEKIENLTGISDMYSENLQLLRYEPGQYYNTHHDYIPQDIERPQGVRILTVFLYLNEPEAGGGTNFPDLFGGLTVYPKKGTVLLWPSVLNDDPNAWDERTMHQALPVEKGLKYGANAWVHQRDFKAPNDIGCS